MSGSIRRRSRLPTVSIQAVAILVEAQGEVRQAESHLETLLLDVSTTTAYQTLVLSIKAWLDLAYRATTLSELEHQLQEVDQGIQDLLKLLEKVTCPPATEWLHRLQLARDWLDVSRGKVKVALTYARLEQMLRSDRTHPPLEH
ncbi:MAG: hypothetical protein AAB558_05000 [Patescibacteria group bacterium]